VISVEVVYAAPDRQLVVPLRLAGGSTVAEALARSGLAPRLEAGGAVGIFGRACAPDTVLHDGDRVEIYRPLAEDPKVARRKRAARARR